MISDRTRIVTLLSNWARWAERWWYPIPGHPEMGCFGTGYNTWGVQTNQKYLAAMAVLAAEPSVDESLRALAQERALQALRFSLASHRSGSLACTDGTQWGRTWISALGIERMMHGVHLLEPHMSDADRAALHRMFEDEANWLLTDYQRGQHKDIQAGKWGHSGKNDPESNIWNGAVLWRAAAMYPNHPNAKPWRERALRFLAAGVTIDRDATDATIYDGLPLKDRYVGSSFFDSFALDHHAYFNVGYMVICASNAAILHFDLKHKKLPAPQLLHLHQADLWKAIRPLIFEDGRLCRVGGDSRVRYAYCQEYLLPSLLYAVDHLGDSAAEVSHLVEGALELTEREAAQNGDGSFYSRRLAKLNVQNPYYVVRLEGDRVNGLSMLLAYAPLVAGASPAPKAAFSPQTEWVDNEYGAAVHRTEHRIASIAWRAWGLSQAMCVPPDASDLAEWEQNLAGEVRFVHNDQHGKPPGLRSLVRCDTQPIEGGFLSSGTLTEGVEIALSEGWWGRNLATHYLAYVALPDGRSMVGLQVCRTAGLRTLVAGVKGLRLNLPNDVFNGQRRQLRSASGEQTLTAPPAGDDAVAVASQWMTIDDRLSVVGLYGAEGLTIDRSIQQRGGGRPNLNVEQICYTHRPGPFMVDPGTLLLDCGWMVSCADATTAIRLAERNRSAALRIDNPALRGVQAVDTEGRAHVIVLNASETPQRATILGKTIDLAPGAVQHWLA